ncbi:MAG: ribosome-associated translation inhibitor RaiA [bacterium]|nr:ribosome-associated translation inhibitor RaiA [bacterium]
MTIQTNLKVTGLELTPALRSYVEEKTLQIGKFVTTTASENRAEVEIGKTTEHHRHGEVFKAEINLHTNGKHFYAMATTEDLYASLDKVKDEMIRQITSAHNKEQTLFRRGSRRLKNLFRGWGR